MAHKKNKTGLIIGLLAVGGLAWWYFTKKPATATPIPATALPPVPGTGMALPPPLQVAPTAFVPGAAAPPVATPATVSPSPVAATPLALPVTGPADNRVATIQAWANSTLTPGNLAAFNAGESSFTPTEWAGLFDLYFNDWIGGQGNNAARIAFWNDWRAKYHVNDGTYP
jgi:hypothetical protein